MHGSSDLYAWAITWDRDDTHGRVVIGGGRWRVPPPLRQGIAALIARPHSRRLGSALVSGLSGNTLLEIGAHTIEGGRATRIYVTAPGGRLRLAWTVQGCECALQCDTLPDAKRVLAHLDLLSDAKPDRAFPAYMRRSVAYRDTCEPVITLRLRRRVFLVAFDRSVGPVPEATRKLVTAAVRPWIGSSQDVDIRGRGGRPIEHAGRRGMSVVASVDPPSEPDGELTVTFRVDLPGVRAQEFAASVREGGHLVTALPHAVD